jgi:hypothetical protein
MSYTSLVGTEKLEVQAIAANGQLSAQTQGCTTQMIADLAAQAGQGQTSVSTVNSSATTNTTLAATTLSVPVLSGDTYGIYAYLATSANATGGIKVALGGTANVSSCNYTASNYAGATLSANGNTTTFGNAVGGANNASTLVILQGSVAVATGGTLVVEFAQNTSYATATQVLAGSYLTLA